MSFFKNLFGGEKDNREPAKNAADHSLLEKVEVVPGLRLPKAFADHWPEIEKTKKQFIAITATPTESLTLRQSKFGDYPCIPKGFAYPLDMEGNPMYPLAQINCRELPPSGDMPLSGFLQFYIAADDVYGISFDEAIPNDVSVLFFEESEVEVPEEDLSFLDEVLKSDNVPVMKPHALTFRPGEEYIGLGDHHGEHNPHFNLERIYQQHPSIADELEEMAYDVFSPTGHKLGGYAYFTQQDPRDYSDAIKDHVLLFQMDSDEEIMWGDVGVANFFIRPEDLAKRDFSRVFYTWDCH